jgi:hypothetical protein
MNQIPAQIVEPKALANLPQLFEKVLFHRPLLRFFSLLAFLANIQIKTGNRV